MQKLCVVLLASLALALVGGADAAANDSPPLGSTAWKPTAENPVGWRGDGTGRFIGATPPVQWGRTVKGFYAGLQCLGGKPAGPDKAGELLNMGFVRDWVIVGPFDTRDFKTGIDEEILKDEANLAPTAGEKAGKNAWEHWHISVENQSKSDGKLLLDFAQAFGKTQQQEWQNHAGTMEPWAAYAQSSIWSPAAGKVRLRIEGNSAHKAWLNGQSILMPVQYQASPVVELKQGWNNLVVKCVSSKGGWNFVAHIAPAPPYEYETKNIQWMTRMPGPSWCSPIIVGDKIFVSADGATLVCINKADGKVLWMRSTTYYHAIDADEQKKFADLEPKVKQLDEYCDALPAMINATISPDGMKADADVALNKKIKDKVDLEYAIQQAMAKADKKKYEAWNNDEDWSKYVPTSDGKYVYAAYWGGNKGLGANVMTCFDLDGKRIWTKFLGQTGISEHGTHCSPALCGNYLIFKSGEMLFGFDKATGNIAWKKRINGGLGSSTLAVHIGRETLAYVPQAGIFRPSDGTLLWKAPVTTDIPTPVIQDGTIFGIGQERYFVYKLPTEMSDPLAVQTLVKLPWKDIEYHMPGIFTDSIVASPLYANGLIYLPSQGGAMNVIDAKTGQGVYHHAMDSLNPRLTWVFVVGICSSATLGGNNIYVRDDQGQTLVLAPGPQYKELSKNLLVEYDKDGVQPEAQSNFYFEGSRIYFRTRAYMYCIGER
ncbi:MAG TPA: PQQ-binding-like beta-propeller repeat protein [Tepidisphaeraceae bacterium]|jgi:outer membrane protein assembly factor BamB|nr:PQQ-binding-like beta-propeller repeat protein [Tepidisphaeraceae bacterium]